MPIYEYHCGTCGERVEVLVRSGVTVPACPQCGCALSDKLFSVPHVLSGRTHRSPGHTCCGQEERCEEPPCSQGGTCRHQ
jgi:putative FmdB family regulatory protein